MAGKGLVVASLALVVALPGSGAAPAISSGQEPARNPKPVFASAAAVVLGDETVIAWLEGSGEGARVKATAGAGAAQRLGPPGAGVDAPPVAVAAGDGSIWVVASRSDRAGERLWAQRRANGEWQEAVAGPFGAGLDHHPALAAAPGSATLWIAWIGEQSGNRGGRAVFATRWNGRAWDPAEPLPRSVGPPMAPTIAVDSAGVPAVAWAASDGADAEIWISRRVAGRWSAPFPLSNNDVPDITPSLAVAGDRLLVAWITYARNGYLPQARIGQADRWGAVATLDDGPGSRALAVALDGTPAVFWRRLDDSAAGGTITGRRLGASGWGPSVDLTAAAGSPFSLASSSDGGVVLTWTRPNGTLGTLEGRGSSGADAWEALFSAATRSGEPRLEPPLPRPAAGETSIDPDVGGIPALYAAFGDSITNGVLMDPDRRESEGYRGPLESLLRGFFGFGTVLNAGRDGESTADGVGRIGTVVRALNPDVVLIMEGTNDVFADIDESVIAFNLQRIIERARGEKPDILPFLAQLPPRFDPSFGFEGSFNESVDLLNALLVPIAAEIGVPLVDVNTALENQPDLWSDPLHPSVAGYQVMGETWYGSIKPVALDASNRGDIDGSGRTDGVDLVRLALAFGAIVGEDRYNAVADINGDGIVDGFDLNVLAESFGRTHSGPGS